MPGSDGKATEQAARCWRCLSSSRAMEVVRDLARDGDTVVVSNSYLAQMVEGLAATLALDIIIEVDRGLESS